MSDFSDKIDPENIIRELRKLIEIFRIKNKVYSNNEKNISDPPKN